MDLWYIMLTSNSLSLFLYWLINTIHILEGLLTFPEKTYTGIPGFSKVWFTPLCFHERLMLVRIFTDQKKCQEDFAFMEKGKR